MRYHSPALNNLADTLRIYDYNLSAVKIYKYYADSEATKEVVFYNELPERLMSAWQNGLMTSEEVNNTLRNFWVFGRCERLGTIFEML
jgi:hypothetical protein